MRYEYNHTYAYQAWRKKYPDTPDEMFVYYNYIGLRWSTKWFEKSYRFRYDGCLRRGFTLFKCTVFWGQDYIFIDDEDDSWSIYKEQYEKLNKE